MSGTSADGVDTALVRLEGDPLAPEWEVVAYDTLPFSTEIRSEILAAAADSLNVSGIAHLHVQLGDVYSDALNTLMKEAGISGSEIEAVALHGQTVFHDPDGEVSLQLGSAAVVAQALGCDVVYDFRSRDLAAGGEGAPLVPYADAVLLRDSERNRIAQNIGGIANLTWLPAGRGLEGIAGVDTGPGNMVIDGLVQRGTGSEKSFDAGGELAAEGEAVEELLESWQAHPFLHRQPPKSTGREEFGAPFIDDVWNRWGTVYPLTDLIATAVEFTVESIAFSIEQFLPSRDRDLDMIVSGGGARNPVLMERLAARIAPARLILSDDLGLPVDAKEAVAFALLADAFLLGVPSGIPAVTGAREAVVLGSLVPGPNRVLARAHSDTNEGSDGRNSSGAGEL
jgi:anhydro-N-acetylmuramic acid kinase